MTSWTQQLSPAADLGQAMLKREPGSMAMAGGFFMFFSRFAYVYGVFASGKREPGSMAMIGSSTKRLVGLSWDAWVHGGLS